MANRVREFDGSAGRRPTRKRLQRQLLVARLLIIISRATKPRLFHSHAENWICRSSRFHRGQRPTLSAGGVCFFARRARFHHQTAEDSLEDFKNVYDFEEAFVRPFAPAKPIAPAVAGPPGLPAPKSL